MMDAGYIVSVVVLVVLLFRCFSVLFTVLDNIHGQLRVLNTVLATHFHIRITHSPHEVTISRE